jgi:hypothetical protein
MKKNLKKYNDFINESLVAKPKLTKQELDTIVSKIILKVPGNWKEKISDLRDEFEESVIDMSDFFPGYFSDMCKKEDANPEGDYQEMQKLLDKKGWNFESIKNLFSEEANKLVSKDFSGWFNSYGQIGSQNGHCDVYLYFTAKNLGLNANDIISLGGDGWANYNEGDEMYIRYRYGYHQTKYGQLMLDQIGYTVEQFREEALVYLQTYIKEHWDVSLIRTLEKTLKVNNLPRPLRDTLVSLDIKQYTVVEEDRMIIFTNEIASLINKEGLAEVNSEDIANDLIKQFNWVDIDMQEIDGDVVIWGKFKVDF